LKTTSSWGGLLVTPRHKTHSTDAGAQFTYHFLLKQKQTKIVSKQTRYKRSCYTVPTKSFVKIGITKIFCYNNKMFSYINKTFGCCSKIFVAATKNLFVVPNFVAVTKPFFSVKLILVSAHP